MLINVILKWSDCRAVLKLRYSSGNNSSCFKLSLYVTSLELGGSHWMSSSFLEKTPCSASVTSDLGIAVINQLS